MRSTSSAHTIREREIQESRRSNATSPEIATLAPQKLMEDFRRRILMVLKGIVYQISDKNKLGKPPTVRWQPISIHEFEAFVNGMSKLYDAKAISKQTMAEAFGYNFDDEMERIDSEEKTMQEKGITTFNPSPFGPKATVPGQNSGPSGPTGPKPAPSGP